MSIIAVITARGGSKRIPRKNIRDFCGKPIIAYSIDAALKSEVFDKVIVSTDDEEIKAISEKYGAEVPFIRSADNSDDFASTTDVLKEVDHILSKDFGDNIDYCCLYPTAPFISSDVLKKSYIQFKDTKADSLVPVTKFSFPPQRAFTISDNKLKINDKDSFAKRSQDLKELYHDCGQYYFFKSSVLSSNETLITDNTTFYIRENIFVQDIDEESDWKVAELKFRYLKNENII